MPANLKLIRDSVLFLISISIAWWIVKSGILLGAINLVLPVKFLAEFIAGMLYTSFLTTPISVASFIVIADQNNPIIAALIGGIGAVFADLLIMKFFLRNKFIRDDLSTISRDFKLKIVTRILKALHLEFLIIILGLLIIASPLPDELGLTLLSQTKIKFKQLAPVLYIANTLGIMMITIPVNLI